MNTQKSPKLPDALKKRSHKKKQSKPKEIMNGIHVYNIPLSYTIEQFAGYFRHCGIPKKVSPTEIDAQFLNEDEAKKAKEGILYFLHEESVQKALEYYDHSQIEPGYEVTLEGVFEDSGRVEGRKYDQRREDDWDDTKLVHVVIKNMFDLTKHHSSRFFKELKEDIEEEITKKCGVYEKVTIFETNPEGVVVIKFKEHEAAERCVALMNERWFDRRKLVCSYYDGYTNYKGAETKEEEQERIRKWEEYIEKDDAEE